LDASALPVSRRLPSDIVDGVPRRRQFLFLEVICFRRLTCFIGEWLLRRTVVLTVIVVENVPAV
jgi:hypothetical protein